MNKNIEKIYLYPCDMCENGERERLNKNKILSFISKPKHFRSINLRLQKKNEEKKKTKICLG